MRKIFTLMLFVCMVVGAMAQDASSAGDLKNQGNVALKAKKYSEALTLFEKAIAADANITSDDKSMVYNMGYCGYKSKNYDKAVKYFDQSIKNDYKAEMSFRLEAFSYLKQKNVDSYVSTLEAGIAKLPNSKALKGDLCKYYVKQANAQFKKGADIMNTAIKDATAGKFTTEDAAYKAEIERAKKEMSAANPILDKALAINPDDAMAKQVKVSVESTLGSI